MFTRALELAQVTQTSQISWATTYLNLGTCYRKLGCALSITSPLFLLKSPRSDLAAAEKTYIRVLEIDSRSGPALGFLGLVYHLMGRLDDAIQRYHDALALNPLSMHVLDLLTLALDALADTGLFSRTADTQWAQRMRERGRRDTQTRDASERIILANREQAKGLFFGVPPGPDLWEARKKQLEDTLPPSAPRAPH
jgi:anaphase-promoting complex subunit 6